MFLQNVFTFLLLLISQSLVVITATPMIHTSSAGPPVQTDSGKIPGSEGLSYKLLLDKAKDYYDWVKGQPLSQTNSRGRIVAVFKNHETGRFTALIISRGPITNNIKVNGARRAPVQYNLMTEQGRIRGDYLDIHTKNSILQIWETSPASYGRIQNGRYLDDPIMVAYGETDAHTSACELKLYEKCLSILRPLGVGYRNNYTRPGSPTWSDGNRNPDLTGYQGG